MSYVVIATMPMPSTLVLFLLSAAILLGMVGNSWHVND